jgi:hypothetical protein
VNALKHFRRGVEVEMEFFKLFFSRYSRTILDDAPSRKGGTFGTACIQNMLQPMLQGAFFGGMAGAFALGSILITAKYYESQETATLTSQQLFIDNSTWQNASNFRYLHKS